MTISGYLPFTQAEQGLISLPLIIIGIMVADSVWASCWFAMDARKVEPATESTADGEDCPILSKN